MKASAFCFVREIIGGEFFCLEKYLKVAGRVLQDTRTLKILFTSGAILGLDEAVRHEGGRKGDNRKTRGCWHHLCERNFGNLG